MGSKPLRTHGPGPSEVPNSLGQLTSACQPRHGTVDPLRIVALINATCARCQELVPVSNQSLVTDLDWLLDGTVTGLAYVDNLSDDDVTELTDRAYAAHGRVVAAIR
jgi:hypothetical protein